MLNNHNVWNMGIKENELLGSWDVDADNECINASLPFVRQLLQSPNTIMTLSGPSISIS